eukprot:230749_1
MAEEGVANMTTDQMLRMLCSHMLTKTTSEEQQSSSSSLHDASAKKRKKKHKRKKKKKRRSEYGSSSSSSSDESSDSVRNKRTKNVEDFNSEIVERIQASKYAIVECDCVLCGKTLKSFRRANKKQQIRPGFYVSHFGSNHTKIYKWAKKGGDPKTLPEVALDAEKPKSPAISRQKQRVQNKVAKFQAIHEKRNKTQTTPNTLLKESSNSKKEESEDAHHDERNASPIHSTLSDGRTSTMDSSEDNSNEDESIDNYCEPAYALNAPQRSDPAFDKNDKRVKKVKKKHKPILRIDSLTEKQKVTAQNVKKKRMKKHGLTTRLNTKAARKSALNLNENKKKSKRGKKRKLSNEEMEQEPHKKRRKSKKTSCRDCAGVMIEHKAVKGAVPRCDGCDKKLHVGWYYYCCATPCNYDLCRTCFRL